MNEIFIELHHDEDVSALFSKMIRARGFSVLTTLEAGNLGKSDAEQLEFAVSRKKVLLTHNHVDFETLVKQYFEQDKTHFGIIIAVRRLPNEMAHRLLELLNQNTADEMINQIRYI